MALEGHEALVHLQQVAHARRVVAGDLDDAPAVRAGDVAEAPRPLGHELQRDVVLDDDDGLVLARVVDSLDAREVAQDAADLADAELLALAAPALPLDAKVGRRAVLDGAALDDRRRVPGDGGAVDGREPLVAHAVLELLLHEREPVRRAVQVDEHRGQVEHG